MVRVMGVRRLVIAFFFSILIISVNAQSKLLWEQLRYGHFQSVPGKASTVSVFQFSVSDPTQPLVITAPVSFQVATDGINFSRFAIYDLASLRAGRQSLYVRFFPHHAIEGILDTLQLTGASTWTGQTFYLHGSTMSAAATLDVVNWNIEWFGSKVKGFGPDDDDLAQKNIQRVMDSIDADVYAFAEVVDTLRFHEMISARPEYGYLITHYSSGASNNGTAAYAAGQKMAFVYRKSIFSNIYSRPLLLGSLSAKVNWANGRFPWLIEAASVESVGKKIYFVLLHGKSGILEADYQKRKEAAKELKDSIDWYLNDKSVMLIGDFNDDLDTSIAIINPPQPSSYDVFVADSIDSQHYAAISRLLSLSGSRTMASYPDPVDHLVISEELKPHFVSGSVRVVNEVSQWIKNYSTTTSDHFPVLSRFTWPGRLVTAIGNDTELLPAYQVKQIGSRLMITTNQLIGTPGLELLNLNGQRLMHRPEQLNASSASGLSIDISKLSSGFYVMRISSQGKTKAMRIFIHP